MREEEVVIRYRMPPIPVDAAQDEKKMMEETRRNFGGQVIEMVMEHLKANGVELVAARKKDFIEIQLEKIMPDKNIGEISVPKVF